VLLLAVAGAVALGVVGGGSAAQAPGWVSTALRYTGGTAGAADAKRTPVAVGFVHQQGGAGPSYPESVDAAVAAVRLVNSSLGGIRGRPLVLLSCPAATDAQLRACAQKFVDDPAVKLIVQGGIALDTASFHQVVGGRKPTLGASPSAVADGTARNAYYVTAPASSQPAALAAYVTRYVKPKTVVVLAPDTPQLSPVVAAIRSALETSKVKVSVALVDPATSDVAGALSSSGAARADAIVPLLTAAQCVPYAAAIRQLGLVGKPEIAIGGCFDQATKRALGDYLHETAVSPYASPLLTSDPEVVSYRAAMRTYVPSQTNLGTFAPSSFAAVLAAARVLGRIGGTITTAAVSARLAEFRGPVFMGPRTLRWGKAVPGLPAVGTAAFRFYTYLGKARWKDATGGRWVAP
jgi:branched-chain amino acid transport system substrate-binding protein